MQVVNVHQAVATRVFYFVIKNNKKHSVFPDINRIKVVLPNEHFYTKQKIEINISKIFN